MKVKHIATITLMSMAAAIPATGQTFVEWSTLGNVKDSDRKPVYTQRFTVTGDTDIDALGFNRFARKMTPLAEGDVITEIVPGYYTIQSPRFGTGADTVIIDIETAGNLSSICYAAEGMHTIKDGKAGPVVSSWADIIASPELWTPAGGQDPMPYGDTFYDRNEAFAGGQMSFYSVVPSYKQVMMTREMPAPYKKTVYREVPEGLGRPGQWRAQISDGVITVEAAPADMALAKRRLAALDLKLGEPLPGGVIEDWPDFPYRGVMIDISRNYQTPAEMNRLLDLMAIYGLNVLHYHFADDEAWRLEIPGLPELTAVGSRRGYTTDEADFMAQLFAGNGNPDDLTGSANGYFTRDEFIAMLRHADSLGITVIPEVESPGHARAAIKAMENRFRNTGDDTYCLIDRADTSVYSSAQSFHDNVMNPVLPGPVKFMTHVAKELKKMYEDAGLKMPALHIGGDEVAKGAWTGSPVAKAYMDSVGMTNERLLHLKFVRELLDELIALDIPVSGWQEIAVGHDDAYNKAVLPYVYSVNCWSTIGRNNSVTAQSARAGYPTVLSNVDHFYLDMCYSAHPLERGLNWGGYVDEFDALDGYPAELCKVDADAFKNVIGVSGQLFSETIRSPQMIESFLLPKMLGLAERGWNADTTYNKADFNRVIGAREMPRWKRLGYNYHVAQPGIKVIDGNVAMNTQYDASLAPEIRYTTDGTNPTLESALYTGPVAVPAGVQVRAIAVVDGKASVPSILYVK